MRTIAMVDYVSCMRLFDFFISVLTYFYYHIFAFE